VFEGATAVLVIAGLKAFIFEQAQRVVAHRIKALRGHVQLQPRSVEIEELLCPKQERAPTSNNLDGSA